MQKRKGRSHQQQARSRQLQQATSSRPTAAATSQATAASSGPSAGPQQSSRPAAAAAAAAAGQAAGQATGQQQASGVQASSSSRSAGAHPQAAGRVLQQYCWSYVCIVQGASSNDLKPQWLAEQSPDNTIGNSCWHRTRSRTLTDRRNQADVCMSHAETPARTQYKVETRGRTPSPKVVVNAKDGKETKCALECHVLKAI